MGKKPPRLDLAGLAHLRDRLQDQARAQAEERQLAEQRRREQAAEAQIFRRSVGDITPLPGKHAGERAPLERPRPEPLPRHTRQDEAAVLQESLSDEFDADTLLETDETLSFRRPGLSTTVVQRLRRGHWVIQAQIDLHGLRRDEAREALAQFLHQAVKRGLRCVRVIHGKGLGSVNREPVLKHKVRIWLAQKNEVMAFCQARAQDGGSGALVVLLQAGSPR
ncbi:Smr/MutS family protein [Pandoraea sp.]|uniref:Smr/MutS family protein n=1 Tax=Pandoraea sp. TaxID=1883445 RepID=UPI0011FE389E|nr:Smr/MutS family protein [Pandoraea sp.]TAL54472.1 MAG: DNA mismatch repair protein MutS [Pandoraea sp.]TAM17520.1 MAG: DNA mismatch repair protein MutS [Pandoraea sp.]